MLSYLICYAFPPLHEEYLDTIYERIEGLEKRPTTSSLDARVPELLSRLGNLEPKVASINDLISDKTCLEALNSQAPR